jgi:hypothetical protein
MEGTKTSIRLLILFGLIFLLYSGTEATAQSNPTPTHTVANETPSPKTTPAVGQPALDFIEQIDWSSWALVVVAIGAAWVALKTLNQIAIQTAAARVAADAAKESANTAKKAITDLERPWIFARLGQTEGWTNQWPASENGIVEAISVMLNYSVQNYGRSPAFVIDSRVKLKVIPIPVPANPEYGEDPAFNLIPLAQGVLQPNKIGPIFITKEQHQALRKGEAFLMFFGYIKYRDTLGSEHISRWCATLSIQGMVWLGKDGNPITPPAIWDWKGPTAYTQYT